jgi:tRNA threonylcarbamoyladenosine biosynthesis protein TsaE
MRTLKNQTLKEVQNLAQVLAKKYRHKDVVIGLVGPLGAGKTTFAKSFAAKLGIRKAKSPSFIISNVYPIGKRKLHHFDFYRLANQKQLAAVEFDEILAGINRLMLIEWVDKFPELAEKCDLILTFEVVGKNKRNVTID